jgi:hypothetical protein
MELRTRLERLLGSVTADVTEPVITDQLGTVRQEAGDLLSAAEQAIDRTLSGNSEAFLNDCVQEGGQ